MNLRWKIEKLDDAYDAITILEMPEERRATGYLGAFAGVEIMSAAVPDWWNGVALYLPGDDRSRDLDPIEVPHTHTPRIHAALLALEEWHRTGEKPVEAVEYGEFPTKEKSE